jgi:hypothetical protein
MQSVQWAAPILLHTMGYLAILMRNQAGGGEAILWQMTIILQLEKRWTNFTKKIINIRLIQFRFNLTQLFQNLQISC